MIRSILISLLLLNLFGLNAQTPSAFKYQTSVRDNTGKILANKLVAFKLSLLQGNENGTAVYAERHSIATNDFGVANLNVGGGAVLQSVFNNIDWANGPYFLKIELDVNNGTNYVFMGTSQLLSVPYALFAAKSANAADDQDKDSTNEIQNVSLTGNNLQLSKNGGFVDLSKYATDSQSLSLNGNTLSISRGNTVVFNDKDKDSTNEIQNIVLTGNNLQLTKNGGNVDLSKYATDSQSLSLNGNTLSISRGNTIVLSGAVDLDADPINEIQNLVLKGDSIALTKGNTVRLPKDGDTSSINEIQSLSILGDTLRLSGANSIVLPKIIDNDTLNELQTLQQIGNNISLSKNGGNVSVPSVNNVQNGSILYATAIGTNTINLTLTPAPTSYTTGMMINFKMPNTNTGHVTINLNGLGNKALFKNNSDTLNSGELIIGRMLNIIFDGAKFQLVTQLNNNNIILNVASFAFDTISNQSLRLLNNLIGWIKLPLNHTIMNEGVTISRLNDTIFLQPGLFEIDCSVGLTNGPFALSNLAYSRLRLRNVSNNTTSILGIGSLHQVNSIMSLKGFVKHSIPSKYILEAFSSDGAACYGNSTAISNTNGEREQSIIVNVKKLN